MAASWMMMLVMLLGDGGNHLLDYASTQEYWKLKGVAVTADAMAAELRISETQDPSKLVVELGAAQPDVRQAAAQKFLQIGPDALPSLRKAAELSDPEISGAARRLIAEIGSSDKKGHVRRLMAIRALGELGQKESLAVLRPLADSKEMFTGEYVRRAIAMIEGQPIPSNALPPEARKADVMLLPAGVRVVLQSEIPGRSRPLTLEKIVEATAALPGMDKQTMLAEMTRGIIDIAEQTGDVRIDSFTMGVAGDIGDNQGYAALILRGEFDATAVKATVQRLGATKQTVEGIDTFSPAPQFALLLADNSRGVALLGPKAQALPAAAMAKALKSGSGELAQDKEMARLLAKADMTLPLWGVMKVTEAFRRAPVLAPFDTLMLAGQRNGEKLDVSIAAQGTDAAGAKRAVDMINAGVQQVLPEMKRTAEQMPPVKAMIEVVESVKATANGNNASLTMSMKNDTALMMPMMLFGFRAHAAPVPQPVAPAERQ